ncbi:MAG: hypothetical protein HZC03_01465 [Candidatus Lloydbacteria bacterium]|nr:hypothetical protein [Candidatus Lloydbacteria bacterium]
MEPNINPQNIPTKTDSPKPIVRTYQSDVATALKEKKGSIVHIAAAEEKRRQENANIFPPDTEVARKKKWLFIGAASLVVIGMGIVGFLFFAPKAKTLTGSASLVVPSIVFVNSQKEISIDGKDRNALVSETAKEIKGAHVRLDFIEQLFFTKTEGAVKTLVTVRDFFSLSSERIPPVLLRSFEGDYLFGIHAFNGNTPFLIVRLNSFENAFSGMLKWEKFMTDDLLPLFGKGEMLKKLTGANHFEDYLVVNQDTRALRDSSGDIVFLYAFPDKNTLVMTTDQDTFKEIIDRLKTPKPVVQ